MARAWVFLVVAALLSLPGIVWIQGRDAPALADQRLSQVPKPVADSRNGRARMAEAAALLTCCGAAGPAGAQGDAAFDLELLAAGGHPRGEQLVAESQAALDALPWVLDAPHFQLLPEDTTLEDPQEVRRWRLLGALLVARARLHGDAGRRAEALADLELAVRLGRRVEGAEGGALLHALLGLEMRRAALSELRHFALERALPREQTLALTSMLETLRSDPDDWHDVWAGEYRALRTALIAGWGGDRDGAESWALHPNRTLNRFAAHFDHLARESARPCAEMVIPRLRSGEMSFWRKLRVFLAPNGAGEVLFEVGRPDARRIHERRCLVDTKLAAVQATLAVHAHEAIHGSLPDSLDDLVPGLLSVLPEDAFDGQPLRYAADRRLLWSVGIDSRDAGGKAGGSPDDPAEPSWRL